MKKDGTGMILVCVDGHERAGIMNKMIIYKSNHKHTHNFLHLKHRETAALYTRLKIQDSLL